jgi:hypothetical protein
MQTESAREYGKSDLVELLTGVINKDPLGWHDSAISCPMVICETDMPKVYQAVKSYWNNRIRNYGENGNYTLYFLPAFKMIEKGFNENNFRKFSEGCELLLNLIAKD